MTRFITSLLLSTVAVLDTSRARVQDADLVIPEPYISGLKQLLPESPTISTCGSRCFVSVALTLATLTSVHAQSAGVPSASSPESRAAASAVRRQIEQEAADLLVALNAVQSIRIDDDTRPDPGTVRSVRVQMPQRRADRLSIRVQHGTPSIPRDDDPFAFRCFINGTPSVREELFNRVSRRRQLNADAPLPGPRAREFWRNATGVWLLIGLSTPTVYGQATSFDNLQSRSLTCRASLEEVHGRPALASRRRFEWLPPYPPSYRSDPAGVTIPHGQPPARS